MLLFVGKKVKKKEIMLNLTICIDDRDQQIGNNSTKLGAFLLIHRFFHNFCCIFTSLKHFVFERNLKK